MVAANSNEFSWIGNKIFSSYPRQPSRSTLAFSRSIALLKLKPLIILNFGQRVRENRKALFIDEAQATTELVVHE